MKTCLQCHDSFRGRSDKKFCGDYCRNTYNNQQKAHVHNHQKNILQRLQRNYDVLCRYIPNEMSGPIRIRKQNLTNEGFNWIYCTETRTTSNNSRVFGCFEFKYFLLNDQYVIIMKDKEE
jgi:hypothetical protein